MAVYTVMSIHWEGDFSNFQAFLKCSKHNDQKSWKLLFIVVTDINIKYIRNMLNSTAVHFYKYGNILKLWKIKLRFKGIM